jgi:hypothetical protein
MEIACGGTWAAHMSNSAGNPHNESIFLSAHWQPHAVATFSRHALSGPGQRPLACVYCIEASGNGSQSLDFPFFEKRSPSNPSRSQETSAFVETLARCPSGVQPRPRRSHAAGHRRFPKPIPFDSQKTGFGLNLTLSTTYRSELTRKRTNI